MGIAAQLCDSLKTVKSYTFQKSSTEWEIDAIGWRGPEPLSEQARWDPEPSWRSGQKQESRASLWAPMLAADEWWRGAAHCGSSLPPVSFVPGKEEVRASVESWNSGGVVGA